MHNSILIEFPTVVRVPKKMKLGGQGRAHGGGPIRANRRRSDKYLVEENFRQWDQPMNTHLVCFLDFIYFNVLSNLGRPILGNLC